MKIRYEPEGFIVTIVIDGGDGNLLTQEGLSELDRRLHEFDEDAMLRSALLRGAGEADFCAGSTEPFPLEIHRPLKPVVAAATGRCLDAGLAVLGRASHFRVAAENARFGLPQIRRGVAGGAVGSELNQQLPYTAIARLALTGAEIDAAEAQRVGLVSEVVAAAAVFARAQARVESYAEVAPLAIRGEFAGLIGAKGMSYEDALFLRMGVNELGRLDLDALEGVNAFLGKRSPTFVGAADRAGSKHRSG
jgi:enoyl-CoA hydratase